MRLIFKSGDDLRRDMYVESVFFVFNQVRCHLIGPKFSDMGKIFLNYEAVHLPLPGLSFRERYGIRRVCRK